MKTFLFFIPSIICIIGAIVLKLYRIEEGWGWLLLIGYLFGQGAYTYSGK
jgi:1,4-dihydroxy-2-naphthoate octaprenyltransferase